MQLYDLFYKLEAAEEDEYNENQRVLAFANFIAHIAFLASLPCPTFNTRLCIDDFLGVPLKIEQPNYDSFPDKNELAIWVLFENLDPRTVLFCWKAILL